MPGNGPLPSLPPTIKIPNIQVQTKVVGTLDIPSTLPFYYAGVQSIWLWWQVKLELLDEILGPLGMRAVRLGTAGAVNVNFFNAVALYGQGQPGNPGAAGFNETELNILACPIAQEKNVPTGMTLAQFLAEGDQTKRMGNYRVWVACDNAVAVAAGQQLFFENKFLTPYTYDVPALNNPGQATYSWTCHDPKDSSLSIYQASVDLRGLTPTPGNMSEWIDLSYVKGVQRVAGSRRNYLGMYDTYALTPATAAAVSVSYGKSTHPMRGDMEKLLGTTPAAAVQTFSSPTAIAEARPYWADQ